VKTVGDPGPSGHPPRSTCHRKHKGFPTVLLHSTVIMSRTVTGGPACQHIPLLPHQRPLPKHQRPPRKHQRPPLKHQRPLLPHPKSLWKHQRPLREHRKALRTFPLARAAAMSLCRFAMIPWAKLFTIWEPKKGKEKKKG